MRCETQVCGRSIARVAGPNPADCLDVFLVCCVGNCYELITRSEESYQMCVCLIVCGLETSTMRHLRSKLVHWATKKIYYQIRQFIVQTKHTNYKNP